MSDLMALDLHHPTALWRLRRSSGPRAPSSGGGGGATGGRDGGGSSLGRGEENEGVGLQAILTSKDKLTGGTGGLDVFCGEANVG